MRIESIELRRVVLPLVSPFRTSFTTETVRDALLVRVRTDVAEGWGECVAGEEPLYSSEYVDAAAHVLEHHLVPRLPGGDALDAAAVAPALAAVRGHPMAKAALEMAILDAELRTVGRSFAEHLGAVRPAVEAGVSIGIQESLGAQLDAVARYLDEGYRRIKLKIEPGWDVDIVRAVREAHPDILLQVDANTAYTIADAEHLARLDPFDLLLIEQPLPEDDLRGHAALAQVITTPVCLDESITSARSAAEAIAIGACAIVNIKAGRVGGYLEAVAIHDLCHDQGVPVWCGGMLETGLGRAANVALAALPGFSLPNDTSATERYFTRDIVTHRFALDDGRVAVPTGPGLGVEIDEAALEELTTSVVEVPLQS